MSKYILKASDGSRIAKYKYKNNGSRVKAKVVTYGKPYKSGSDIVQSKTKRVVKR